MHRDSSTNPYLSLNIWSLHCHANVVIIVYWMMRRDSATDHYLSVNLGICMAMLISDYNAMGGVMQL